jgi:hypothetical protein
VNRRDRIELTAALLFAAAILFTTFTEWLR